MGLFSLLRICICIFCISVVPLGYAQSTMAERICQSPANTHPLESVPRLFGAGIFSSSAIDTAISFHPHDDIALVARRDGAWGGEALNKRVIQLEQVDGVWTEVGPIVIDGVTSITDPFISLDGQTLLFTGPGEEEDTDLWMADYDAGIWVNARRLGHEVNSSANEYQGSMDREGHLYFASDRAGGLGQGDVYLARWVSGTDEVEGHYASASALPTQINSTNGEWNISVAPDASFVIFESSGRDENITNAGDLYISWWVDDAWTAAQSLRVLSSPGSDLNVSFHPSGKGLYLISSKAKESKSTNIYYASINALRPYCVGVKRQLLVVNRSSHSVDVIGLDDHQRQRLGTGKGPHLMALNPTNHRLFTANYGIYPEPHDNPVDQHPRWVEFASRTITVNLLNQKADKRREIDVCDRPHGLLSEDDRLWVTCENEGEVLELNPNIDTVVNRYKLDKGVHYLLKHPSRPWLFATNRALGNVSKIQRGSGEVSSLITAKGSESMSLVNEDELWVANHQAGRINVIELNEFVWIQDIESVKASPSALAMTPDGEEVWATMLKDRAVHIFSTHDRSFRQRIPLEHVPLNIGFDPVTQNAFISLPSRNKVVEIDRFKHTVIKHYEVGSEPDDVMVRIID